MFPVEREVFELTDENSAGNLVKYQKGTRTVSNYLAGICTSITLSWIQRTLDQGPLADASDLGPLHRMAIAFGSGDIFYGKRGMQGHFDTYSLDQTWQLSGPPSRVVTGSNLTTRAGLIFCEMREPSGAGHGTGFHIVPASWKTARPSRGRFALGGHRRAAAPAKGAEYYFFDPNYGLFRWSDVTTFTREVLQFFRDTYPSMMNGSWTLYGMTS